METKQASLPIASSSLTRFSGSCSQCHRLPECGGLDGQSSFWGCFSDCQDQQHCDLYDWTCPCRPAEYLQRWGEVGGLQPRLASLLRACVEPSLPVYLPMVITHGLKTVGVPALDTVALTTFELMRGSRNVRWICAENPDELRGQFRLRPRARVLLVSVANDNRLSTWWSLRKSNRLPAQLAQLGVFGITVPNFSFFTDAPRTHTLWNRARMIRCAEEFSAEGLSIILHLNALTRGDWDYWAGILREHPEHRYVAKEFQTGLLNPSKARQALRNLAQLQDRIGRELHPLLIGGARLIGEASRLFRNFTLIDSRPWMTTIKRQQAVLEYGKLKWRTQLTEQGEALDSLLEHNLAIYTAEVHRRASRQSNHPTPAVAPVTVSESCIPETA